MTPKRPLILVTNDDGISSRGIYSLQRAVASFGEVVVVAPDSAMSGMGHAITISEPLRLKKGDFFDEVESYSCSGTPVDCVKLGIYEVLHRKPDLIISGINHGANTATNVLYSGTMSAAVEGAMEGIPSIGFSLYDHDSNADFDNAMEVVKTVVENVLKNGLQKGVCLNVNVPKVPKGEVKGIQICRQAHAFWEDRFDKRMDPFNKPYYWLTGDYVDQETADDTDLYWIDKGYVSIVPIQFDMTAYKALDDLKEWKL